MTGRGQAPRPAFVSKGTGAKTMMRFYDRLIVGLAVLGALSLAAITALIIVDVILRNTGFRPFQSTSAIVEYVMLFATMAAAPWLVRENGHVAIGSFVAKLPDGLRVAVGRLVLVVCILALGLLTWRSAAVGMEMIATRSVDMRSINIPAWVLYAMLGGGFFLMAIEFLRILLRGETYSGAGGGH
jgi:C4-dicarboxylate transporter, DctQ subunit